MLSLYGVKQWLHARPVSDKDQLSVQLIPDGKSKNTVHFFKKPGSMVHIAHQDHFCVTLRLKKHTLTLQLCAQLFHVVDFTVIDNAASPASFPAHHRLMAALRIQDGESYLCKSAVWPE